MGEATTQNVLDEVAIIGMAGRFPGAKNIEQFWQNLRDGLETVKHFSEQELLAAGLSPELLNHPNYVRARGILEEIEMFDAAFFGFNPREAEITDPQHRLFLECSWEALEHAGWDSERFPGSIGVYAGVSMSTYLINLISTPQLVESVGSFQIGIGNEKDFMPTRVSYKLNLKGPSINVQCACSTSLVAVCLACQSLLNYQCDMALAGGVTVIVPQESGYIYQAGGIASPDGHCRAFDARAQGTVSSNGVGVVVLKRLADAIADSDTIYAVIKGSAVNNDGGNKIGYTAPSVNGQVKVIAEAQSLAAVEPETISYVEAHGTATAIGDPIEIAAITEVFRAATEKKKFCAIGSVKTNIGHVDSAAGVAGLIKAVLALNHKLIPPSLHFETANPQIDFDESPFYISSELTEWASNGTPRRAGVNSFGVGGTNAHIVLEEYPLPEPSGQSRPWQALPLSAKSESALISANANLAEHLRRHPTLNLADVAFTLQQGRRAFRHRTAVVCADVEGAVAALEGRRPDHVFNFAQEAEPCAVAFMFPGQGAQHVNMGLELYETEPTYRATIDYCAQFLEPRLGLDLRKLLYPAEGMVAEAGRLLNNTRITQPALFATEYALAKLWMDWIGEPQAMIGHSIGEYVAACLAGVLKLEDALLLVAARGQMIQELPVGYMLSVSLAESEIQPLLGEDLSLAAVNAPSLCTVSGAPEAIESLERRLSERRIAYRRLQTSHAFHSKMVESIVDPLTELARGLELSPPQIPYISNVTGDWVTAAEITDGNYWGAHLRRTVRFSDGLNELLQEPGRVLLEVGPGQALSALVKQRRERGIIALPLLPRSDQQKSDVATTLAALARLWVAGVEVDWVKFSANESRRRVALPTYPFERQRYWIERRGQPLVIGDSQPRKNPQIHSWFYTPAWTRSVLPENFVSGEKAQEQAVWLVFVDEYDLGRQLIESLAGKNIEIIRLRAGADFGEIAEAEYQINPRSPGDYHALFDVLGSVNKIPQTIVHLWNVAPDEGRSMSGDLFAEQQWRGYYSLLYLAQAMGSHNITSRVQLYVISNGVQEVDGDEFLHPEKSTILGPCKVIPQEYPNISCRTIDISLPAPGTGLEQTLIAQISAELQAASSEVAVAYRGAHRWVERFEAIKLSDGHDQTGRLRDRGVYLITGGLGRIALALAEHLARTAQARLALLSRSTLPAREDWDGLLDSSEVEKATGDKIRKLKELEKLGAEVITISADVSDEKQMSEALNCIETRFGQLNGVIHAAGVLGEDTMSAVLDLGPGTSERQFQPKVHGLLVLEKLLRGRELDFWFLTSSLSSILGGLGFSAYASANIFMDVFARRMNQIGPRRWMSVNWDAWLSEGASPGAGPGAALADLALTPTEGIQAFQMLLNANLAQTIVSTADLQKRVNQWIKLEFWREAGQSKQLGQQALHRRPDLQSSYIAPRDEVEGMVAETWQTLLGMDRIGVNDNFFELGGHSLLATQLMSRLRDIFHLELSLRNFFESPTIAALATAITQGQESESLNQILTEIENLADD